MNLRLKYSLYVLIPVFCVYVFFIGSEFSALARPAKVEKVREMTALTVRFAQAYDEYFAEIVRSSEASARFLEAGTLPTESQLYDLIAAKLGHKSLIFGSAIAFEPYAFRSDRKLFSPYGYGRDKITRMDIGQSDTVKGYDYTQPQWEWWNQPRLSGVGGWSAPYFDKGAGNTLMVTFSEPFVREGKFAGVVTADVELPTLHKLAATRLETALQFSIIDSTGRYVYHSDPAKILTSTIYDSFQTNKQENFIASLRQHLSSKEPGHLTISDGTPEDDSVMFVAPIKATDWTLLTMVSSKELLSGLHQQRIRTVAVFAGTLLLIAIVIWGVTSSLISPLAQLEKASQSLADPTLEPGKDLTALPLDRPDEIGALARSFRDMASKLKSREEQIRKLEGQRFRALVQNLPGATFRCLNDEHWTMNYISAPVESFSGYPSEDFLQNKVRSFGSIIHEDDKLIVKEQIQSAVARNEGWEVEYRVRHKDGSIRWVRERGRPQPKDSDQQQYLDGIILEITAQKEAQVLLAYSERRLRDILDNSTAIISLKDTNGTYSLVNNGFEEMVGLSRAEIVGRTDAEISSPAKAEENRVSDQKVIEAGGPIQFEQTIPYPDGSERVALVSKFPLRDAQDQIHAICAFATDITVRKKMELEVQRARAVADAANQAKSDFLANMSHEIRTPMNAVMGLTHLALKTELTAKQRDYLNKIHSSATNLLGIINDILDFSKIEAGKLDMEKVDFRLDEVLESAFHLFSDRANEKGLELLLDRRPGIPDHLVGDPLRLSQVLINFMSNAIKFTSKGEVVVRLSSQKSGKDWIELLVEIADSGIGMSPEQQERLFISFSQGDTSTTRNYGGTGLGLAITKRLVELMEGTVSVESAPGVGSVFRFTARFGLSAKGKTHRFAPTSDLRGLRVLIVDDNATSREALCHQIESFSFIGKAVSSAEEAIRILQDGSDSYSLVLMDWKMDGMSGMEASRHIKEQLDSPPKIIMVTNYGREEIKAQADRAGLDGFLIKPVSPSVLFDSIVRVFSDDITGRTETQTEELKADLLGFSGSRVLLVEDNQINQQVAGELLEQVGINVTVANNGKEALQYLENEPFELVLMDLQMPVMDGYEATARIRAQARFDALPVIAMTAHAMAGERAKCLEAGMNEHVTKPIDPEVLYQVLGRYLETKGTVSSSQKSQEERWPTLVGIDIQDGLKRLGGNRTLYKKLLIDFSKMHEELYPRLLSAVEKGDHEAVLQLAHTLKGTSGNLGAKGVFQAAAALESAAGKQCVNEYLELTDRLKTVWLPLIESLGQLKIVSPTKHEAETMEPAVLAESLRQLEECLVEGDTEAEDLLASLEGALRGSHRGPLFEKLKRHIGDFDFDEALSLLRDDSGLLDHPKNED